MVPKPFKCAAPCRHLSLMPGKSGAKLSPHHKLWYVEKQAARCSFIVMIFTTFGTVGTAVYAREPTTSAVRDAATLPRVIPRSWLYDGVFRSRLGTKVMRQC